jgi:hypothetical protein
VKQVFIITIIFAFMLMLCGTGWADEPKTKDFKIGFKGGITFASFSGIGTRNFSFLYCSRKGLILGGFMGFSYKKDFIVQPELYFAMKGKVEGRNEGKCTYEFNYLELPVLLKYEVPTVGPVIPSIFFGPSVALKLVSKKKSMNGTLSEKVNASLIDFGLVMGGGFDFKAGSGKVCFDARYSLGLTRLTKPYGEDLVNEVLIFLVGYSF